MVKKISLRSLTMQSWTRQGAKEKDINRRWYETVCLTLCAVWQQHSETLQAVEGWLTKCYKKRGNRVGAVALLHSHLTSIYLIEKKDLWKRTPLDRKEGGRGDQETEHWLNNNWTAKGTYIEVSKTKYASAKLAIKAITKLQKNLSDSLIQQPAPIRAPLPLKCIPRQVELAVSEGPSWCVKLIDPAADQHIDVRRRQFHGIYMPAAWQMRASWAWVRMALLFLMSHLFVLTGSRHELHVFLLTATNRDW